MNVQFQTICTHVDSCRACTETDGDGNTSFVPTKHDEMVMDCIESLLNSNMVPIQTSSMACSEYLVTTIAYTEKSQLHSGVVKPEGILKLNV